MNQWLALVPPELTDDALWTMPVYRSALFATDLAWHDINAMRGRYGMRNLPDQLYRAVCSVSANIAEGYSRASGKDRRRFYEYALGSARESRDWYFKARNTLKEPVAVRRIRLQTDLIRQLLTLIPKQTAYAIRESSAEYVVDSAFVAPGIDEFAPVPFEDSEHTISPSVSSSDDLRLTTSSQT